MRLETVQKTDRVTDVHDIRTLTATGPIPVPAVRRDHRLRAETDVPEGKAS